MAHPNIIAIGGSAGAIEPVKLLIHRLPPDFPASLFVVIHSSEAGPGNLGQLLASQSSFRPVKVTSKASLEPRRLYTPAPGLHLSLRDSVVRAVSGPRENRFRPSIDVLFRTAARAHRERVIGILLSGYLDDGVSGLGAIQEAGGITIVQSPEDAAVPDLPANALDQLQVDYSVPAARIPALLRKLVKRKVLTKATAAGGAAMPDPLHDKPSRYICPDCGGTLFQVLEGNVQRFRCRVGHAFSDQSLLYAQGEQTENTLWAAQRALQERADLLSRMASRYKKKKKNGALTKRFRERAEATAKQALAVRELLESAER